VLATALVLVLALAMAASSASAETVTLSKTETIPVPPASHFAGSGGGDGWAVALSEEDVYNVFHHQQYLGFACHLQSNAEPCYPPEAITEPGTGVGFDTAAQPGLYLDHHTGKLYVYATRRSDQTAGVVCIDTTEAAVNTDPFCGFTELTGKGEAPFTTYAGVSGASDPQLIGTHWYSFNFASAKQNGTENELMCFDVSTDAACAGQPYAVNIGSGEVTTDNWPPSGETAAIAGKVIIPLDIEGASWLACYDDATQSSCGGKWPVKLSFPYTSDYGAPFPLMTASGTTTGLCLPTGTDQCFNLEGEEAETPAEMPSAILASSGWDGPGLVLGPRVYTPNGEENAVDCFDYSTGKSCAGFPKDFQNLGLLYTVNPDPQRPTCIWVNSDNGSQQIQNFNAYGGESCAQGTIRVLGSQFVVPQPQCTPASYVSLQVLKPARSTYASGTVAFDNGDGEPIGLEERTLDATGSTSLSGLELNTPTGLPQFLFTLNEEQEALGAVEVKLTWTGNYEEKCVGEGTQVVKPPPTPAPEPPKAPESKAQTLPFKAVTPPVACTSKRSFTIHIQNVKQLGLVSAVVSIDGHVKRKLSGKQLRTGIDLAGLPKGTFTMEIVAKRKDGRTVRGKRVYHTCVSKLPYPKRLFL